MASGPRISAQRIATLLPAPEAVSGWLYRGVGLEIASLVLDGRIVPGTRMPSERELAAELKLSRTTVASAFAWLREHGYLITRGRSGSFVAVPTEVEAPSKPRLQAGPRYDADEIDFTVAALPAPDAVIETALAKATSELPGYSSELGFAVQGIEPLREAIAAWFRGRGVPTSVDQVMIIAGALQGIDLLLRATLVPGDRVLTTVPTYAGALDVVRGGPGRLLPVPLTPAGRWDVPNLVAAFRQSSPKVAYLTCDFLNPTGALASEQERREVLAAAHASSTLVIVDETCVGLGFEGDERPCAAIDPGVVTVGSLSKSVWGGLRIGWVRADTSVIGRLTALRGRVDLGNPVLEQLLAAEIVPQLPELAAQRALELKHRYAVLAAALAKTSWTLVEPDGGLSAWVELEAPGAAALSVLARSAGIKIAPGARFGLDGTLDRFIRIPFTLPPQQIERGVARLWQVWNTLDHRARFEALAFVA